MADLIIAGYLTGQVVRGVYHYIVDSREERRLKAKYGDIPDGVKPLDVLKKCVGEAKRSGNCEFLLDKIWGSSSK